VWYIPLLGQYFLDELSASNYTVTVGVGGTPITVPVFKTGAIFEEEEETPKGEIVKRMLVEAPISLIDGASGSALAFINDPEQLKFLCTMWNAWINTSGVSQNSVGLVTLGTDKGINVLCSISMTRIWNTEGGGYRKLDRHVPATTGGSSSTEKKKVVVSTQKKIKKKVTDTRLRGRRNLMNTIYTDRKAIVDVSQGELFSAPYEQIQSVWILPIIDDEVTLGVQSTVVQRWQFMNEEGCSKARTSGETGISLASLNSTYASKMVRSKLAPQDDWSQFFVEMARLGRGGVLTGLVAGLVGSAFPQFGGIAKSIADALPI